MSDMNYTDTTNALIRRMYMLLEDGDWAAANSCCEKVLDSYPECADAYLGKLMIEYNANLPEKLCEAKSDFSKSSNFARLMQFADEEMSNIILPVACEWVYRYCINIVNNIPSINYDAKYDDIMGAVGYIEGMYDDVISQLQRIPDYRNSDALIGTCIEERDVLRNNTIYEYAIHIANEQTLYNMDRAVKLLESISDWKDTDTLLVAYREKLNELREIDEKKRKESQELWNKDYDNGVKKRRIAIVSPIIISFVLFFYSMHSLWDTGFEFIACALIIFATIMVLYFVFEKFDGYGNDKDYGGILTGLIVTGIQAILYCAHYIYYYADGWLGPIIIGIIIYVHLWAGGFGLAFWLNEKIKNR